VDKVTYAISNAVERGLFIGAYDSFEQRKSFRWEWNFRCDATQTFVRTVPYFTEVRHVILFGANCPFLQFTTGLFKTHFNIRLPSAPIKQRTSSRFSN
jgi:hypothetical protein